jgi:hypothetical protein
VSNNLPNSNTSIIETHCYAADLMWDEAKAAIFRETMGEAIGRDCVCDEGEPCWLYDRAFELIGHDLKGTIEAPFMADFLAVVDAASEEHKRVIFGYVARGLGEDVAADALKAAMATA